LEPGEYQYRYFANGGQWHDDWQADAYVPNQFGAQNSVVRVTALEVEATSAPVAETPTEAAPAPKKRTTKPKAEKAPKDPSAPKTKRTKKSA
jgi:hypothetical protein